MNVGTIALMGAGGLFLWSGFHGASVTGSLRDLLSGSKPPGTESYGLVSDSSSTGSTASPVASSGNPTSVSAKTNQATGKLMASAYGWSTGAEWTALNNIVMAESGWNNTAQNPSSTAFGIGQFLDSTWATVGYKKTSDPVTQIAAMLAYIKQRYGDPIKAWNFHLANGYY